jgi:hypothetical protein
MGKIADLIRIAKSSSGKSEDEVVEILFKGGAIAAGYIVEEETDTEIRSNPTVWKFVRNFLIRKDGRRVGSRKTYD